MNRRESEENNQFDGLIRKLIPINELSVSSCNQIINQSQITSFAEGAYIFKQGDKDEYTFYLLDGLLEMQAMDEASFNVSTKEDRAKYPLAQVQPRKYSAKTLSPVKVLQINRNMLEGIVAQEKSTESSNGLEVDGDGSEESLDWMSLILQSSLFSKIPAANIQQLFVMLQPANRKTGDVVIKQGDAGDYYYIIQEGRCEVSRVFLPNGEPEKLAELSVGASFGEESLLSGKPRNATVTMLTDGILMRLSKENFIELIKKPTLDLIFFSEAQKLIEQNGLWLDVRSEKEYERSHVKDSINIPIFDIRRDSDKLQLNKQYVVYSNTKRRGSAAAFLLTELGFNVRYLENGLASIPESIKELILYENETIKKERVSAEKGEVKTSDNIENKDEDLEKLDKFLNKIGNTSEQEAITAHRVQRNKLQDRIKNIIVNEQGKAEQKASLAKDPEEVINENQEVKKTKEHIDEERKKLEELHARNLKEKEELRKLKHETETLIKKEREAFEFSYAQQQSKLFEERKKIEEDAIKIQETLREIQSARDEAEETRRLAEEEARQLRQRQTLTEEELTRTSLNLLNEDIRSAENKLSQAQKKLIYADQAEKTIKTAKQMNEQDIIRHKEEEDRIQKQLEEEMAVWSKEQEEHDSIIKQAKSHSEHIRNIKEKRQQERKEAEEATRSLFSDIKKELHKR